MPRFTLNYHFQNPSGPGSDTVTWEGPEAVADVILGAVQGNLTSLTQIISEIADGEVPDGTRLTTHVLAETDDKSVYKFVLRNAKDNVLNSAFSALWLGQAATTTYGTIADCGGTFHPVTGAQFTAADYIEVIRKKAA